MLEEIAGFHLHRGALAAMNRPLPAPVDAVVAGARRVLLPEGIVDHTNLGGAIFRSAAALGGDAVRVSPHCAGALYPRTIRVSMGAVFQVPWARLEDWNEGLDGLGRAGFTVAAMDGTDPVRPIDGVAAVAEAVVIPMREGIESLNVAAASTVAMWELRAR